MMDALVQAVLSIARAISPVTTIGMISAFAGTSAPAGWLMCDGSAVSRTTYATLFTLIGTAYGVGDGSTTFNLPDLRGRVAVGKNAATFSTLGGTGGEETHLLTTAEMPSHSHIDGFAGVNSTAGYGVSTAPSGNINSQSGTSGSNHANTSSTGGGGTHNNIQPYQVVNYIVRAA